MNTEGIFSISSVIFFLLLGVKVNIYSSSECFYLQTFVTNLLVKIHQKGKIVLEITRNVASVKGPLSSSIEQFFSREFPHKSRLSQ